VILAEYLEAVDADEGASERAVEKATLALPRFLK
jgi:hypothetical protein